MPRLFWYGSLQQSEVQLATFGRLLAGNRDALVGFELQALQRGDKLLANVVRSSRSDSRVSGTTFEVSEVELAAADTFEHGDRYTRIPATLASGEPAWVYVDAASLA
jgi:gamma-glutamylcyclotransferase (GGCT)/AIG2-like uncharacterized protein YtfP